MRFLDFCSGRAPPAGRRPEVRPPLRSAAACRRPAGGRAAPGSAIAPAIPSPAARAQGSAGAFGAALRIPHAGKALRLSTITRWLSTNTRWLSRRPRRRIEAPRYCAARRAAVLSMRWPACYIGFLQPALGYAALCAATQG
ncbi:MAG: hypothetical protein NZM15_09110, partial [Flavobacteriales bacterium]|nr:hypothetical protein [Flavobacteriales bacterium]MDW8432846.1 hypothetical protein [Flavobacteriales bacterium]